MRRDDFNELRAQTIESIFKLNDVKGADYAGDEDALGNFKDAAGALGITPEQVWAAYSHKHWSAIMSFCKKGQVESEPIEGRIHDVMVYCVLLLGLIEDRKAASAPYRQELGVPGPTDCSLARVDLDDACRCGRGTIAGCQASSCPTGLLNSIGSECHAAHPDHP